MMLLIVSFMLSVLDLVFIGVLIKTIIELQDIIRNIDDDLGKTMDNVQTIYNVQMKEIGDIE